MGNLVGILNASRFGASDIRTPVISNVSESMYLLFIDHQNSIFVKKILDNDQPPHKLTRQISFQEERAQKRYERGHGEKPWLVIKLTGRVNVPVQIQQFTPQ